MDEAQVALVGILHKVETDLALPDRFVLDLVQQDDWSFTIKAHALLEAAVTQVLTTAIPDSRLHDLVSSLNLAGRHSKLAYAEALNLLDRNHMRFLNELSQIRNIIVHHIREVRFTFRDYIDSLDPDRRKALLNNLPRRRQRIRGCRTLPEGCQDHLVGAHSCRFGSLRC